MRLLFQEDPAVHEDYELFVTADEAGNIYWDQWAPETHDIGVRFYLLASDSRSRAQTTFTDGNLSSTIAFTLAPTSVTPGGTLNWSVDARCEDGGGPNNTCASEGFTHDGPVQDGYTVDIQRATNAGFTQNLATITTVSTTGGTVCRKLLGTGERHGVLLPRASQQPESCGPAGDGQRTLIHGNQKTRTPSPSRC